MKLIVKLILIIVPVSLWLAILTACFNTKAEIKVVTDITSTQVSAIQKEFGFELPENASVIQCRLGLPRDWPFTIAISGIKDVEEFIQNNLHFEVEEPYEIQHFAYDEKERTQLDKRITAVHYFGMYNGSKRRIYIYQTDIGAIVEFEKSGVVLQELLEMF